jgi:hypothetical protein
MSVYWRLIVVSYQVRAPILLDPVSANASKQVKHPQNQISLDPIISTLHKSQWNYTPSSEKKTDLRCPPGGKATVSPF